MTKFLSHWAVTFLAVLAVGWMVPALVRFDDWQHAALFALLLALLNAVVRPVILLLTLPLSCLTLGVFALVVNGAMFWLAAVFIPGVHVGGFVAALIAALAVSAIGTIVSVVLR